MTADERAALVEKVGRALAFDAYEQANVRLDDPYTADAEYWNRQANIAIDLIRADVLAEAARVVRRMPSPSSEWMAEELLRALGGFANPVPDAIRALKDKQ